MARIPRAAIGDMVYHVLNRANGREQIFNKEKDYQAFKKILFEAKEKYPMRILSFCIMPNHWHLILYPRVGEDLSKFMRWITHTHTQRWHAHYKSVGCGHVYQGRYKSFPIEKNNYFLQACRYIERNPLRVGLVKKAENWRWSSLWIRKFGTKKQKLLLSEWPVEIPASYLEWTNTSLKDEEEKLKEIRNSIQRGRPFGETNWIKKNGCKTRISFNISVQRKAQKRYPTPFSSKKQLWITFLPPPFLCYTETS
jgi:putative transposase